MKNPDFIVPPPGLFGLSDADAVADAEDAQPTAPAAAVPALSIPAFVPTVLGAPPRPAPPAWQLSLADGQTLTVTGALVLGRDPAPAGHGAATMVRVIDAARSVSKSHALVELVEGELWVTDLHSTNGVSMVLQGQRIPLDQGVRTALAAGVCLSLGEFAVQVSQA